MPNQFLSDEFGDIEDYFVTDYWLIDQFMGDQLFTSGFNSNGQLGDNTTTNRNAPVTTFAGGTTWKQVASGCQGSHTAAIKTDGSLWGWGNNGNGQLGTNDTTQRNTPVTTFSGQNNWKQVSCGYQHTAAIKTDGTLWIWGRNIEGQLGINVPGFESRTTPVTTFAGGNNWKSVSCGSVHTVAIKTDGSLWAWGSGFEGRLGTNDTNLNRLTPVTTFAGGNDWKSVFGGSNFTAAIKTDGSLWEWGWNGNGQIGNNNATTPISTPVTTFAGGNNWKSLSCGNEYITAIKTDGSLWTWGYNNAGQLGINVAVSRNTPVTTFAGGTNWKFTSCGYSHTAAIKTDGSLWVWGSNTQGQYGDSRGGEFFPVIGFAGGNNWKQVSAGRLYTAAVKSGLNVDLSFFPVGFVSDGLVLYLDAGNSASYPGTGTTWTDLSGNGNTGTLVNGIGYSSANGGFLILEKTKTGVDDERVTLSASSSLGKSINYTTSAWIRYIGGGYLMIVDSVNYGVGGGYMMWLDINTPKRLLSFDGQFQSSIGTVPLDTWTNVCISKSNNQLSFYINGSFDVTRTFNFDSNTSSTAVDIASSSRNPGYPFNGKIAQVLIYNRALSATEIKQNFNFFKPRFGL